MTKDAEQSMNNAPFKMISMQISCYLNKRNSLNAVCVFINFLYLLLVCSFNSIKRSAEQLHSLPG